MDEALIAPVGRARGRGRGLDEAPLFAALDLGTNNCRLLIATPSTRGFRIVDAYSRIVRLGEGLSQTGHLADAAMERALSALAVCAAKIERRGVSRIRAVATQACRAAANGAGFVEKVERETGLRLTIITPREEAQLAVAGCLNLIDHASRAALVLDVGGGSTEMSWLDLTGPRLDIAPRRMAHWRLPIKAWLSVPIGVVTLAEQFPEREGGREWFRSMVEAMKVEISRFTHADDFRDTFDAGEAHIVGTSGAITSLAGIHLRLRRYERAKVDGLWMTREECDEVTRRLGDLRVEERAAEPCIGPDRADLVMAGAAILTAVQEMWPCRRVRVADRGLREGLLLSLMSSQRRGRTRRNRTPSAQANPR
jgi:exopolyphosphatase/guanosine-5'-triphosphate,3'-diphosphate pyrophosphatase